MTSSNRMHKVQPWGDYKIYSLENKSNTRVDISDLGATIVNFFVDDKNGCSTNIVLGYDSPDEYLKGDVYLGAVVGPWANRIAEGRFELNGEEISVDQNEGSNHLHGGSCEIHKRKWHVEEASADRIVLNTRIEAMSGGFPANLEIFVTYRLTEANELCIDYSAFVDRSTPVNLTQHSYFNLNGGVDGVGHHLVAIEADTFWDIDETSIPTQRVSVEGCEMDFKVPKYLYPDLMDGGQYIKKTQGFDHCWCVNGEELRKAASVYDERTGIGMTVSTDQSGIQFYSGNFLQDVIGRKGKLYQAYSGLCLETQHYPNQVNMDEYKEYCIYSPVKPYRHRTVFKVFSGS